MAHQILSIETYHARLRDSAQRAASIHSCPYEFIHDQDRWQDEFKRAQFDRACKG